MTWRLRARCARVPLKEAHGDPKCASLSFIGVAVDLLCGSLEPLCASYGAPMACLGAPLGFLGASVSPTKPSVGLLGAVVGPTEAHSDSKMPQGGA